MNRKLRLFLPAVILLSFTAARAQVNDAGLWLSAEAEKKITQSFSAFFAGEVRLNENMTEVGTVFGDLGGQYRFGKRFQAAAAYRLSFKRRPDDTYERRNGWYVEARYREKINPVIVMLRLRCQSKYAELNTSDDAAIPKNHLRARIMLKYDTDRKYEPYVYAEGFWRVPSPAMESFDQFRLCAGVEYRFNRMHSLDLHYLVEKEINVKNPETSYVIGISYKFTF